MSQTEHLLKRLPNDIGGLPAGSIQRVEHELEPWEKRCHALADVLAPGCREARQRARRQAHLLRAMDCSFREHSL